MSTHKKALITGVTGQDGAYLAICYFCPSEVETLLAGQKLTSYYWSLI